MRLPVSWLRECVAFGWTDSELAERLTALGFEVESMRPLAPPFSGVFVADILEAAPHPQADKLRVCRVDAGGEPLQVVCGAPNARAGLRTALAMVGAVLPDGTKIGRAKLRGVESQGMLCSARELGLAEESAGILELDPAAPVGQPLRDWLRLDESVLELGITPNRGDALSVLGIARELAAASGQPLRLGAIDGSAPASTAARDGRNADVRLEPGAGCARFASCRISSVDNTRPTPAWLRDRLARCGLRSISPVVDITNLVLMELGQPMHAYDAARLSGPLTARLARAGEGCELLDGQSIRFAGDELVIADEAGPVGFAGVMGGARTAIQPGTTEVMFEAAWFDPKAVAGRGRRHGIVTDASQRFERGVDPAGQERAVARAVALLAEITGGRAGALHIAELPQLLPRPAPVPLRAARLERLLGRTFAPREVVDRLESLGMAVVAQGEGHWQVTPPSWRFDIAIEPDLVEELARTAGYDSIPERPAMGPRQVAGRSEANSGEKSILARMVGRGYSEAVTFGFTDPQLQEKLLPGEKGVRLRNPIANDLAVMRASLWPGLLLAARENLRRQRERVRLFEIASRFRTDAGGATVEQRMVAGLAIGGRQPEQWAAGREAVDFHDVKGDVLGLLELSGNAARAVFRPGGASCLHPGRSACIELDGVVIGQLGELHPGIVRELDFTYTPILFELDYASVSASRAIRYSPVSSFPRIRRDISFTVGVSLPFGRIAERVSVAAGPALHELRLFDVYQGKGVESGQRSIALGLILQDLSRTLTDAEADRVVESVCTELRSSLDARIRE